jgi:hypothetical protein
MLFVTFFHFFPKESFAPRLLAKATETAEPITPLAPVTIIVLFFTENIAGYLILDT